MRRYVAILTVLLAAPAAAQTTNTNCQAFGSQLNCRTTTTPAPQPFDSMAAVRRGYEMAERVRQAQAARQQPQASGPAVAGKEVYYLVQDYNSRGDCAESVRYAAGFNDPTLVQFALTCKPLQAK